MSRGRLSSSEWTQALEDLLADAREALPDEEHDAFLEAAVGLLAGAWAAAVCD